MTVYLQEKPLERENDLQFPETTSIRKRLPLVDSKDHCPIRGDSQQRDVGMGDQLLGHTGKRTGGDDLQVVSTECQETEKFVDVTSSEKLTSIRTKFTEPKIRNWNFKTIFAISSLLLFEGSEQFWS